MLALSIVLMFDNRIYEFYNGTIYIMENGYEQVSSSYRLLSETGLNKTNNDVYVYDASSKTDHQIFYIFQFLNYKMHVIPALPDNECIEDDVIVFSNKNISNQLDAEYICSKLDENEYVYYKGLYYEQCH